MNVPIISRRRQAYRDRVQQQADTRAMAAVVKAAEEFGPVGKSFLTGNAALAGGGSTPGAAIGMGSSWNNAGSTMQRALIAKVNQNLMSSFGRVPPEMEAAMTEQGLSWGPPFPPGRPLDPFWGVRRPPRTWDFAVGENVQLTPRWNRISFKTLKAVYNAYDVAQVCVRHLINDVRSLEYNWGPPKNCKDDVSNDIEAAEAFWAYPDRRQPFRTWLAEWLQDVLRYDAGSLFNRETEAGDPYALEVVSGETIIPLIDFFGRPPMDEEDDPDGLAEGHEVPAYLQIIEGLPWDTMTADQLIYQPWNPMPESQYGFAPLEAVLLSANTDLRFQWHFLQLFTEGTIPGGFMEAPPDQSDPTQVKHWQDVWNAVMLGDQSKLNQIRWVPNGAKFTPAKPTADTFDEAFPLYLMRRTCAAFGVTPNDLGYTETVNRATGDTQIDVQFRVGTLPLLRYIEDIVNLYTQQHLKLRARFQFDDGQEVEDRVATAQADGIYVDHGIIGADEVREKLGYPVDKTKPAPRYINNSRSGPIPLLALESMAGQIDPETYGRADGQELVSTPYASPPGVLPAQGSPEQLAAAQTTQQAARDLIEATTGKTPPAAEPGEDQGDDDEEGDEEALKCALELRRWRKAARNRLRQGRAMRKFASPDIPPDLHDEIWSNLQKASTREEVDAAFADVGKPQAGSRPAFHSQADRIVQHYAPQLTGAIASLFTSQQIDEGIEAAQDAIKPLTPAEKSLVWDKATGKLTLREQVYRDRIVKAAEPLPPEEAAVRALRAVPSNSAQLARTLTALYGDSFLQGAHDAAMQAGGTVVASLKGVDAAPAASYWDSWKPGYGDAAAHFADGGMRTMLDEAEIRIKGLTDTTIDNIGEKVSTGLMEGQSVGQVKQSINDMLEDPQRAETIANTEYARAMDTASVQTYAENGVEQEQWLAEPGACPECEANADEGPQPVGSRQVPAHPECRCAKAPVVEGG